MVGALATFQVKSEAQLHNHGACQTLAGLCSVSEYDSQPTRL